MCVHTDSIIILKKKDTAPQPPALGVFETFKTRAGALTGTAVRQRAILGALAGSGPPEERTRTAISQHVAAAGGTAWKNVYSGIFHDIDSVLVPLGLVEMAGRIPPRRGPRALQESGIPYYHLTHRGRVVELATGGESGLGRRIAAVFSESAGKEAQAAGALALLAGFAPALAASMLRGHVRAYCEGRAELLPVTAEKLGSAAGAQARASAEFLAGALGLGAGERGRVAAFLQAASGDKH